MDISEKIEEVHRYLKDEFPALYVAHESYKNYTKFRVDRIDSQELYFLKVSADFLAYTDLSEIYPTLDRLKVADKLRKTPPGELVEVTTEGLK